MLFEKEISIRYKYVTFKIILLLIIKDSYILLSFILSHLGILCAVGNIIINKINIHPNEVVFNQFPF